MDRLGLWSPPASLCRPRGGTPPAELEHLQACPLPAQHVDDALVHRGRVLTCIFYCNPAWAAADGGALRLHLAGGVVDVEPLDGRLLLFWSDARAPHEVLPTYSARYAVSVWYSDAARESQAGAATAAAGAARAGGTPSV